MRDFFDTAVVGLCILGADGRVVDANRAELELLGRSREDYVGRSWSDFHVDRERAERLFAQLAAGGTLRSEPTRVRRKGGEELEVVIDANARFEAGRFVAVHCVTRDAAGEGRAERALTEQRILTAMDAVQQRIGHDLHDGLGQVLAGAAFSAQALTDQAPPALLGPVARLVELLNDATGRVQAIARGLSPVAPTRLGLTDALRGVCAAARATARVECTLEVHPSAELRPTSEYVALCMITQEAMRNAIRHGRATRLRVTLGPVADSMVLCVRDDGSGLTPEAKPGLGVESMQLRASALGGTLTLENHEQGGTFVRCVWPAAPGH